MRAVEIGAQQSIEETEFSSIFLVEKPDVTLRDNDQLSSGAKNIAEAFSILQNTLLGKSPMLHRIATELMLKFAGEPKEDEVLDQIISEAKADPIEQVLFPGDQAATEEPDIENHTP
jgi:hypothetical protein